MFYLCGRPVRDQLFMMHGRYTAKNCGARCAAHTLLLCSLILEDMNTNLKQEEFSEHVACREDAEHMTMLKIWEIELKLYLTSDVTSNAGKVKWIKK